MHKKYIVRLTDQEQNELAIVIKKLKGTSQKVRRAQISSKADADGPKWADDRIAEDLILSVGEVRTHLRILCAKLGITNPSAQDTRVRVVERAFSTGLISEQDL